MPKYRVGQIKLGWQEFPANFPDADEEVLVYAKDGENEFYTIGQYIDGEWKLHKNTELTISQWKLIESPDSQSFPFYIA